jgi:cytochrome c553
MHPGNACITCHATNRSAPKYVVAGTVYPTAHEPNDCNGVNGTSTVTVVITDATGKQLAPIPVNNVGNFYYAGTIASPFHVKVASMGRESAMMESPATGDCNSCHTEQGANSAPGRIMVP